MTSWSSDAASEHSGPLQNEDDEEEDDCVVSLNVCGNTLWWTTERHEARRAVRASASDHPTSMETQEVTRRTPNGPGAAGTVTSHRRHNTALVHPAPGSLSPRILGAGKAGLVLSPERKVGEAVGSPASFKGSNHSGSPSASSGSGSGSRRRCASVERGSSNHVGSPSSPASRGRCSSAERGSGHFGRSSASSSSSSFSTKETPCASGAWLSPDDTGSNRQGTSSPAKPSGASSCSKPSRSSSRTSENGHVRFAEPAGGGVADSDRARNTNTSSSSTRGTPARRGESFGAREQRADSVAERHSPESSGPRPQHSKQLGASSEALSSRGSNSPGRPRLKGSDRSGVPKGDQQQQEDGAGAGARVMDGDAGVGRDCDDVGRDRDGGAVVGRDGGAGAGRDRAGVCNDSSGVGRDGASVGRDRSKDGAGGVCRDHTGTERGSAGVCEDDASVGRNSACLGRDGARNGTGVGRDGARDSTSVARDGASVGRDGANASRDSATVGRDRSRDRGRSERHADSPSAGSAGHGHGQSPLRDVTEGDEGSHLIEPLDSASSPSDRAPGPGFASRPSSSGQGSPGPAPLSDRLLTPAKSSLRQCSVSEAVASSYRHGAVAGGPLPDSSPILRVTSSSSSSASSTISSALPSSCASPALQLRNGPPRTYGSHHHGLLAAYCLNGPAHHQHHHHVGGGLGGADYGPAAHPGHHAHCIGGGVGVGSGPTSPDDFTSSSSTSSVSSVRETLSDSASVGGGGSNNNTNNARATCGRETFSTDTASSGGGGGVAMGRGRSGREGSAHRVTFDMSTCSKDDGHRTCSRRPALPVSLLRDCGGPEAAARGLGRDARSRSSQPHSHSHSRVRTRYESLSPRGRSESLPPRRNCDVDVDLDPSALDRIILELQRTAAGVGGGGESNSSSGALPTICVTGSNSSSDSAERLLLRHSSLLSAASPKTSRVSGHDTPTTSPTCGSYGFLATTTTSSSSTSSPASSTDSGTTPSPAPSPGIYRRKNGFSRSLGEISALMAKRSIVDSYDLEACWFCGRPMVGLPLGVTGGGGGGGGCGGGGGGGGGLSQPGAGSPNVCTRGTRFSSSSGLSSGGR